MAATMTVVVDPYLVLFPAKVATESEINEFIEGIIAWAGSFERDHLQICMSRRCVEGLFDDGAYPYDLLLRRSLRAHGVEHVDYETICRVTQSIFDRAKYLEDACGIEDLLYSGNSCRIEPPWVLDRLGKHTAEAFEHSLILMALWQCNAAMAERRGMIASKKPPTTTAATDLSVSARIEDVELSAASTESAPSLPHSVSASFDICFGDAHLLRLCGAVELWGDGSNGKKIVDAIQSVIEGLRAQATGRCEPRAFTLGKKFIASVQRWNVSRTPALVSLIAETCARIVLDIPKHDLLPFRTDSATNAPQKVREDGAAACRTHLTKHGAGFRLMLWVLKDGTIEFANVGDKDELVIY